MPKSNKGWLVYKYDWPLGYKIKTYLSVPRQNTSVLRGFGIECWDERHDAMIFKSAFLALWQAFRHFAWIERV